MEKLEIFVNADMISIINVYQLQNSIKKLFEYNTMFMYVFT